MARYSNKPFGYINQTTWKPQDNPPAPLISLPRTKWDKNQFRITTGPDPVWIDLVINNLDEGSHPFHLVRRILPHILPIYTTPPETEVLTTLTQAWPPLLHPSNIPSNLRLGLLRSLHG
jgi:hypothetical protein